jgi:hypothetical protein
MTHKIIATVTLLLPLGLLLTGCRLADSQPSTREVIRETTSPAPTGSFSSRVTATRDGSILLTWLEPTNDKLAALRASFWRDGAWSTPITIVEGQPFSRHPSESPGVVALSKNNLIAYWSQKPPNEKIPTQEVDVYFSVSTDRGLHWTSPTLANRTGTGEESSYPSAAPMDDESAALIWLDGANWTKQKRVTLMSRTVHSDGSATEAIVIDPDTCTCCPTSLVQAGSGLLAAYRGHTPENIRDISLLRNVNGRWSQPGVVHADNWHFAGCPVNGPHLDATQRRAVITWFTVTQDQPTVNLAFSDDGGATFSAPIRVDEGNAIGRAQAVLLPGRSAVAFWLERVSGTTRLLARAVHHDGMMGTPIEVSRGSDLGYPHAARVADAILITWVEGDPFRRVHVGLFPFAGHEEVQ